jgi:hypothetical protein
MTSLGTSLAGGCYLGIPHERYLWQVHVIGRDPGVECLCGMKPRDGGAIWHGAPDVSSGGALVHPS